MSIMPRRSLPMRAAPLVLATTLSSVGALGYATLMKGVWAAEALGPICRHGGPLSLHCPACYAAVAMVIGGLALAASAAAPQRLTRPAFSS